MFFIPGTAQADQTFPMFVVQLTGATMIFTRIFIGTGGSVAAMMLMHATANLAFNTVLVFATEGGGSTRALLVSVLYLAAGIVTLATLPRRSARTGTATAAAVSAGVGRP